MRLQAQRAIRDRHVSSMATPAAGALYQELAELWGRAEQLGLWSAAREVQELVRSLRTSEAFGEKELAVDRSTLSLVLRLTIELLTVSSY